MGLLATVQGAVDTAFTEAGDLVGEIWLVRQVQGAYNPATGDSTKTDIEYMFEGIVDTAKNSGTFDANSSGATGSELGSKERRIYLKPANNVEPEPGDVCRVGETNMRVVDVLPVKPDGITVLLWELLAIV